MFMRRVLRGQVRGAVRACVGERAAAVRQVLRAVLRGVQLRAHGGARRRVPLLPRHAHRRAQEEAKVPVKAIASSI